MERTNRISDQPAVLDKVRPITRRLSRFLWVAGCLCMLGGAGMAGGNCMKPQEPFTPRVAARTDASGAGLPLVTETVRRSRTFDIPSALENRSALQVGDTIDLRLFPDTAYRAQVRSISGNVSGTATVVADIDGVDAGYMIAAMTGGRWLITINIPPEGTNYIIHYDAPSVSYRVDELWLQEQPSETGSRSTPPLDED